MELPSSKCEQCPLFLRLRFHVPAEGPNDAEMVFVGEAPGEQEALHKRPFFERASAGSMLSKLFKKAGIDRPKVRITNVLKCQPQGNKLPEDLDKAIDCCSEILMNDIKNAKVIVGLGNVPLYAFTGLSNITKRRGSLYRLNSRQTFLATLHPSFLRRVEFMKKDESGSTKAIPKEVVVADFKRAKKVAAGWEWEVPENFTLYPTPDEFTRFIERAQDPEELIGVDIESTWDKPIRSVPLIISFSFTDWTIVASYEDDLQFIVMIMQSPAKKTLHNGCFDDLVNRNVLIEMENYFFDTLYGHHLGYAELSHTLAFVQSLYSPKPYHKHMKDNMEEMWEK